MSISSEFICKCKKQKGWITLGEEISLPCPSCGRRYIGVYDNKKFTIKAKEIKDAVHQKRTKKEI